MKDTLEVKEGNWVQEIGSNSFAGESVDWDERKETFDDDNDDNEEIEREPRIQSNNSFPSVINDLTVIYFYLYYAFNYILFNSDQMESRKRRYRRRE